MAIHYGDSRLPASEARANFVGIGGKIRLDGHLRLCGQRRINRHSAGQQHVLSGQQSFRILGAGFSRQEQHVGITGLTPNQE